MQDNTTKASNATRPPNTTKASNESFTPYIAPHKNLLEFTLKAAIPGIIFGILFGAANAYLGLQAGLTISTSIPVAVMSVAAFRGLRSIGIKGTILEANMSQTIGSASSSVASGVIFTLPALFMWGAAPELLQMTLLAMCGGLLGVLFMIPLRQFLIEREHGNLPYPEGTACAEVLIASEIGGAKARNVFLGLGCGALFKFIFGWLNILPATIKLKLSTILKAELGMKVSSALFGVGYILGPRIAAIMVGGGLLSALIIIPAINLLGREWTKPFYPETEKLITNMSASEIWDRYVRYIGAGAVAMAGVITLIRSIPTMIESFRIGAKQIRARIGRGSDNDSDTPEIPRTSRDLSLLTVGIGVLSITLLMAIVPQIFGVIDSFFMRTIAAICIVVFAFFFVTVSSRIVGLVGVTSNPTSGMTIASLIGTASIFLLLGWTDKTGMIAALSVGCVVAIAASIAGDTSQDLKTGFILGATPRRQQIGELLGVLTSAIFVCMTLVLLDKTYHLGSAELPAPQGTLMKLVVEGVLQRKLPWLLVGIGAGISLLVELLKIPSLPFAVGVYLPVSTMMPVFFGGILRFLVDKRGKTAEEKNDARESGILFGSGLVGGEGMMGVLVAGVVYYAYSSASTGEQPSIPLRFGLDWTRNLSPEMATALPSLLSFGVFMVLAFIFNRRCRSQKNT